LAGGTGSLADGFFSFNAFLVFLGLLVGTGSMGIVSAMVVEREDERYLRKRKRSEKNKIKNRLKIIFKSSRHRKVESLLECIKKKSNT
jgi:hypothetical protein